jgi:hypothetical protein
MPQKLGVRCPRNWEYKLKMPHFILRRYSTSEWWLSAIGTPTVKSPQKSIIKMKHENQSSDKNLITCRECIYCDTFNSPLHGEQHYCIQLNKTVPNPHKPHLCRRCSKPFIIL